MLFKIGEDDKIQRTTMSISQQNNIYTTMSKPHIDILHPGYGLKHEELGIVAVMVQCIEYQGDRILWTYQDVR